MPDLPDVSAADAQALDPDTDAPDGAKGLQDAPEGQPEAAQTFSAEYVATLRSEAAAARVKAKRTDALTTRLVNEIVKGTELLHDPADFRYSPEDVADADGFPDPEKVAAQVQALATAKPHLARIRPTGNIGQGAEEGSADVSLHALMQ